MITIREGGCPLTAVASPDGQDLWVAYQSGGPGGSSGHDAIAYFDQHTGRLLGSITGLANVGGFMAISPDGRRLLEHAQDGCSNPAYDHEGCAMIPSTLVHVIDTVSRRPTGVLSFPGAFVTDHMAFSPSGRLAVISGAKLLVFDSATLALVGEDSGETGYGPVVFSADGTKMYVALEGPTLAIYALE
jgi:DNA-binding beta-propeller fold protein YncE